MLKQVLNIILQKFMGHEKYLTTASRCPIFIKFVLCLCIPHITSSAVECVIAVIPLGTPQHRQIYHLESTVEEQYLWSLKTLCSSSPAATVWVTVYAFHHNADSLIF